MPLSKDLGCKLKRLENVFRFQIWVGAENLLLCHSGAEFAQDRRDRNSKAADAGHPRHLSRIYGDASKNHSFHCNRVRGAASVS